MFGVSNYSIDLLVETLTLDWSKVSTLASYHSDVPKQQLRHLSMEL